MKVEPPATEEQPAAARHDGGLAAGLLRAMPTPTLLVDAEGRLLEVSESWATLLAEAEARNAERWLPGANLFDNLSKVARHVPALTIVSARLRSAFVAGGTPTTEVDIPFTSGTRSFIVTANRLPEPPDRLVINLTDISSRRAVERQLEHQATHDPLTGLPNRAVLAERLRSLHEGRREGDRTSAAVLFLDLDDFKGINDSLGHQGGDAVLQAVARRLREIACDTDTVARLGGDEFVVVATDLSGELEALAYADRLLSSLAAEVVIDRQPLTVGASVGIALATPDDPDVEALLRDADIAMLHAKASGGGRVMFDEALLSARRQRSDAVQALRAAIASGALHPWFQPVVRLRDRSVVGAEALARWVRGDGTLTSPADFVPLAERTGLVGPLDRAVMTAAAHATAAGLLGAESFCSVNTSPKQVASGLIVDEVAQTLEETGLPPDRLTVELTENAVLSDPDAAGRTLGQLKALGVRIALDDFGTGYSSLSHLVELPIDIVKIDRAFVSRMLEDPRALEVVRAVIGLGTALDVSVIAEGVETEDQRLALLELGCPLAQGFLFGRAVPAADFR